MSLSSDKHDHIHTQTILETYWGWCARFITKNRMPLIIVMMVIIWLGCSWVEYLAERGTEGAQITSWPKALWWGIVTFWTVGYGDMVPTTPLGKVTAGFLMVAGVTSTSIITAKISTLFLRDFLMEGRGAVDKNKIKDHFVICGWKDDMDDLLEHFLKLNKTLKSSDIVIVAEKTHDDIAALKGHKNLEHVTVIIGQYYHQSTLVRAAPQTARKVLILADTSPGPDGKKITAMEADARTIMTAIALANIAKGTVIAAEIIDPSLDHHLKLAGVTEIIYSREYSRLMLGNASSSTGLVSVFHDLIDPSSGAFITLKSIPESFIGQTYASFRRDFETKHPEQMVLGILENTGNPQKIKELALKEAQKTPSVGAMIENLKSVKNLKCNHPIFNPQPTLKIPKGSEAIILVGVQPKTGVRDDLAGLTLVQSA